MAFEYVRGYVQLASGLGELTKARATEAAQGLLSLPGAGEVGKRAMQVTEIADQLLEAARANRESLVALIRSEVESSLGRSDVVRLADFDRARTALAALTREVDDLRASLMAEASRSPLGRAIPGVGRSAEATVPAPVSPLAETTASARPTTRSAASGASAANPTTGKKAAARPTRKTAAQKTAAQKTAAKKSTAKKSTAKKTAATKSTATKSTATKSTARKSAAAKTPAKKSTAKKSTAQNTANGNGTA
jgi:BMFP domain-containing protein YqiC